MATLSWTVITGSSSTAGSLANWMSKASITSGANGIADFILGEAESWIYRRLRHWRMLTPPTAITFTLNSDVIAITSLARFLEPCDFWYLVNGGPYWMTQKTPQEVYASWAYNANNTKVSQQPTCYSFNQTNIQMDAPALAAYPGYITYFQQPAALSGSNTTNFLTEYYPRLVRLACMAGACEWAKDNGQGNFDRTYYDQLAQVEIDKAQAESDRARRGEINAGVLIGGSSGPSLPPYLGGW